MRSFINFPPLWRRFFEGFKLNSFLTAGYLIKVLKIIILDFINELILWVYRISLSNNLLRVVLR